MEANSHALLARVLERSTHLDSLVGSIAEWIGLAIIEGRLQPGDDLISLDLSRQFQTSRTPVREALLLLERENLVTVLPHKRARVARISLAEVREIYEVRAHLLMLVAELICKQAADSQIARLRELLPDMQEAAAQQDIDGYFWANIAFRETEADICGNRQVKRLLDSLGLRVLQLRHVSLAQAGRLEESLQDRERQVRAYEKRETTLAIALARSMVFNALAAIERSGWTGFQNEQTAGESD
jgi:DNA-binding GntR family transcriptional regulator